MYVIIGLFCVNHNEHETESIEPHITELLHNVNRQIYSRYQLSQVLFRNIPKSSSQLVLVKITYISDTHFFNL